MTDRLDVSPSERVAIITYELACNGREINPEWVADNTECDLSTAYKVLKRISRVIPLYEEGGRWALVRDSLSLNIE